MGDQFADRWGPILRGRQDARVAELDRRVTKIQEEMGVSSVKPIQAGGGDVEVDSIRRSGSLRQSNGGVAAIDVNVDPKEDTASLKKPPAAGLPAGYTFTEFTGCDSGTPFTYWIPIWDTNPEA